MSLLTEAESKALSQAIEEVEQATAGELVVAVVPRSDDYAYPRALFALAGAVGLGWVSYWALPTIPSAFLFAGQIPLWLACWWLSGWSWLVRALAGHDLLSAAVDAKAKQVFFDHGLTQTVDRSGVLIFVSELEHRVQILADKGIHERVGNEEWAHHVHEIVEGIKAGRAAQGLQTAIRAIGVKLSSAFPAGEHNPNELPNKVVRYT